MTESELREADAVLLRISPPHPAGPSYDTASLIESWARLVTEVEAGYDWSIYEYENDVSSRVILSQLLAALGGPVAERLRNTLSSLDERFLAATREDPDRSAGLDDYEAPWLGRIPQRPGPELRRDLERS